VFRCDPGSPTFSPLRSDFGSVAWYPVFLRHKIHRQDLLHQRLRNRHFFFVQLVHPRRPGPKGVGGAKFFKSELLTSGRLVLGVKPPCSPARIDLRPPQLEVFNFGAHCAAETAGLIVERAPDNEDSPLERPRGFDPQEAFTQHDEACYV
jgi:hypothetical protein